MFGYYFTIGLIYLVIGFGVALTTYFIFKKKVPGKFVGALIVALIGSFLGGILQYAFKSVIDFLTNINNSVNIFPPLLTSIILLLIFSQLGEKKNKD